MSKHKKLHKLKHEMGSTRYGNFFFVLYSLAFPPQSGPSPSTSSDPHPNETQYLIVRRKVAIVCFPLLFQLRKRRTQFVKVKSTFPSRPRLIPFGILPFKQNLISQQATDKASKASDK
jgi:hypothetical protein